MIAVDPMRPNQPMTVPGALPPSCPNLHTAPGAPGQLLRAYLHPMSQNAQGDQRFDCLACGYQAVWRHATQTYESMPGWTQSWTPPIDQDGRPIGIVVEQPEQAEEAPTRRIKDVTYPTPIPPEQAGGTDTPVVKRPVIDAEPVVVEPVKKGVEDTDTMLLTIKAAAEILGMKPTALLAKINAGEIKTQSVGGVRFVPESEVGG